MSERFTDKAGVRRRKKRTGREIRKSETVREKARAKRERRDGVTPINRNEIRTLETARKYGLCGGKRRPGPDGANKGRVCLMKAGAGTDHPGTGYCRWHGGNAPNIKKNDIKKQAILMGAPKEINAVDAIVWCIHLTAGEVEFCNEQMAALEQDEWTEHTLVGKQINLWAKERQNATARLMKFSAQAIQLGLNERAIRLAEQYGASIAQYTRGILQDLAPFISPEGQKLVPGIIRKHLMILQGTDPSNGIMRGDQSLLRALPSPHEVIDAD